MKLVEASSGNEIWYTVPWPGLTDVRAADWGAGGTERITD